MKCLYCEKEIPDHARFCTGCGQQIPRCPTCGKVLTKPAFFCTNDGTEIPWEILNLIPGYQEPSPEIDPGESTVMDEGKDAGKGVKLLLMIGCVCLVAVLCFIGGKLVGGKESSEKLGNATVSTTAASAYQDEYHSVETTSAVKEQTKPSTEPTTEPPTEAPTEKPTEPQSQEEKNLLFWIENCDSSYLSKDLLKGLSKEECRLARNAIYARSGRKFKDAELMEYFGQFSWYNPRIEASEFNNNMMNESQRHNLSVILNYEKERGFK